MAAERGADELDTFLDLQIAYGNDLRWYSVVANADARHLEWIMASPAAMIGFSDAGAHLRNMAFYNFGLRMLKRVRDAQHEGRAFMTVEHAVHKLTADIADFYRIDAGRLDEGARADVVVIDPARLDDTVEAIHEEPMPGFAGPATASCAATTTRSGPCWSTVGWPGGTRCASADLGRSARLRHGAGPRRGTDVTSASTNRPTSGAGSAGTDVGGHRGQHTVDEAAAVVGRVLLGQLDGLVDHRGGGHVGAVGQLEGGQPQDRPVERRHPVESCQLRAWASIERVDLVGVGGDAVDQFDGEGVRGERQRRQHDRGVEALDLGLVEEVEGPFAGLVTSSAGERCVGGRSRRSSALTPG